MSKTDTFPDLLQLCLWDLRAGCEALGERLPAIMRQASDPRLRTALEACVAGARTRAARLRETGDKEQGPDNLWMAGILEDGERDTRSIQSGVLLDLAIVGALRKALFAELASLATARAIAASLSETEVARAVEANEGELREQDAALERLLWSLA